MLLDRIFFVYDDEKRNGLYQNKNIKKYPEDGYIAVETLFSLLSERMYILIGWFCVRLTSTVDGGELQV